MFNEFVSIYCEEKIQKILLLIKAGKYESTNDSYQYDYDYSIHQLTFSGEFEQFLKYYFSYKDKCDIDQQDKLGNTPLMIAAKMGHENFVQVLAYLNANILLKNKEGWTALHESISYGKVNQVMILVRLCQTQTNGISLEMERKLAAISSSRDFILNFKLSIETWVPVLSRFLPSDNCTLMKCGNKLRFNSHLLDISNRSRTKGSFSVLISPDSSGAGSGSPRMYWLDHQKKVYQLLSEDDHTNIDKEVALLMSSDLMDPSLDITNARYEMKTKFWPFATEVVKSKIGAYDANMYDLLNVKMVTRKRREHMSQDQLNHLKTLKSKLSMGYLDVIEKLDVGLEDMSPPPISEVSWEDYKEAMLRGERLQIGRPEICKESTKHFKLVVGMCEDFPMTPSELIDVLEFILPLKRLSRLREIFSTNMPSGFPVYIEVPLFPTTTARLSFEWAKVGGPDGLAGLDAGQFVVPDDYVRVRNMRVRTESESSPSTTTVVTSDQSGDTNTAAAGLTSGDGTI